MADIPRDQIDNLILIEKLRECAERLEQKKDERVNFPGWDFEPRSDKSHLAQHEIYHKITPKFASHFPNVIMRQ